MNIKETKTYDFEIIGGELKFKFSIAGNTQEEAKANLISSLKLVLGQLDGTIEEAKEPELNRAGRRTQ